MDNAMPTVLTQLKFAATTAEASRTLEPLPQGRTEQDLLTRKEFDKALMKMADGKAVGPEGIPIEAYKYCPANKDMLFSLI